MRVDIRVNAYIKSSGGNSVLRWDGEKLIYIPEAVGRRHLPIRATTTSLSRPARIVKNGDGALRSRQFSLHYGEHQSCAAFAGDECLAPRLTPSRLTSGDLLGRRGHSAESRQGRQLANLHLRLYSLSKYSLQASISSESTIQKSIIIFLIIIVHRSFSLYRIYLTT